TSPFAFLRGAAAVMAQDLRHQPTTGIAVQACGDCHLMNFGAFATPEENILFDINDFDETLPGVDFTIDLKRLAASVAVAALAAKFSNKRARATAAATVEAYRTRMRALAKLSPLEIWHSRIDLWSEIKNIEDRALRRQLHAILTKAGKRFEQDDNFPHLVKGRQARIVDKPPPGRRRSAYHAGGERRLPGMDARRGVRSTFLRAPTEEPAARVGQRTRRGECPRQLRALMRAHARARTCTLGRSSCARGIHGKERRL